MKPEAKKEVTIGDFKKLFSRLSKASKMVYYVKMKETFERSDSIESTLQLGYVIKWIEQKKLVPQFIIKL